jgi:predicted ester cyclase
MARHSRSLHNFDPAWIAGMSPREIDRLAGDPKVIRNRRKIEATVADARTMLDLHGAHHGFRRYLRSFPNYDTLAKELRRQLLFLGEHGVYLPLDGRRGRATLRRVGRGARCHPQGEPMSEANKRIAQPIYSATESGDVSILDSVLSDGAVEHPLNPAQVRGREAIKQLFGAFHVIVPNLSLTTEDVVAGGDWVAFRSTMRGTPVVPYLGLEPKGRSITFTAIDIWRIAQGRDVEGWHVEDFLRILVDWGVVHLPARVDLPAASQHQANADESPEEDAKTVIRSWYEALHRHDRERVEALLAPEFTNHDPVGPGSPYSSDGPGTLDDVGALHETFPDLDVILADIFAERSNVVARVIIRGTQLGRLLNLPPSGRRAAVMGNEIWRVSGGRIVEHWGRFEELDLLQQLSVLPSA